MLRAPRNVQFDPYATILWLYSGAAGHFLEGKFEFMESAQDELNQRPHYITTSNQSNNPGKFAHATRLCRAEKWLLLT